MTRFLNRLFWALAPLILMAAGGGMFWLGTDYEIEFLLWVGGVTFLVGLFWGALLCLIHSEGGID